MTGAVGPPGAPGEDDVDRLRRRVLWAMPTGLFVVGSRAGDRRNLMTANWVIQVATTPKLVAVGLEAGSVTRALVEAGGSFSVSILARSERTLARRFAKPVHEVETDAEGRATALNGEPVLEVAEGLPCLTAAIGWLACALREVREWPADTDGNPASHVLAVGEVIAVGETDRLVAPEDPDDAVLTMADTRMNYGG